MLQQNCLGYALGITGDSVSQIVEPTFELENLNLVDCVVKKLETLGFIPIQVASENATLDDDQFLIAVWGFFPYIDKSTGYKSYRYDFHIAINRGKWMHKWGWNCPPEETSISTISEEYGTLPYFFAVRKKAP